MITVSANHETMIVVDPTSSDHLLHTPLLDSLEEEALHTVPGVVDYKGCPAVRSKHGRWRSASFMIWVEMAERMTYLGVSANLINFLTGELGQSTATAAANVNAWNGMINLLPILGAVIADSFLGRYYTIVAASLLYILGLCLLTLSAMLPSLSCFNMDKGMPECLPHLRITLFFVALYMVALGEGGHRPCVQAFGADQFDGGDPMESKAKSSFFNWWCFSVWMGALLGIAILSYVQDNLSWGLGYGIPCFIMVIGLLIFLLGTVTYRYCVQCVGESPFRRIGRVFVTTVRNWNAIGSVLDDEEQAQETQPQHGSRQFRFLDKALLIPDISRGGGKACRKSEVEEAKAVLRLFPIWATSLIFAVVNSQCGTFFTKQGFTLERSIGPSFAIPAAALQSFIGIFVVLVIPIYDGVLVPISRTLTGTASGISMLQRIGTGLFISIFGIAVAAIIEKKRLETVEQYGLVDLPNVTVPMSIWWLLPQYALFGVAEAFTMVGLQEFFYDQVPNELRSVGLSLYLSVFGAGSILSSFLVSYVNIATSRSGGESWLSSNLNRAHLDYFYWSLAGLSGVGFALFLYFAKSYIYNKKKFPG